jgi:glc operon protein GlcG
MRLSTAASIVVTGAIVAFSHTAPAQMAYGAPISLDQARKIMAAAETEARKNNWPVAIAIVDSGGYLVLFQRIDNTQFSSAQVAQDKAYSAVGYRRPTKAFQDGVAGGGAGMRLLNLRGASLLDGGLPIVADGKIIGGIGVSGVQGHEDAQVAKAGADTVK